MKIFNVNNLDKFGFYLRFYVLKKVKEVVESQVETQIACYSFNSQQINIIFVFLYFETCINFVKFLKILFLKKKSTLSLHLWNKFNF